MYLRRIRSLIVVTTASFLFSGILGYAYAALYPETGSLIMEQFQGEFGWIIHLEPLYIMLLIFLNNAIKTFLALILGLGFGLVPSLFILVNGFMVGMMIYVVQQTKGTFFFLAAIVPHGVLEIPALIVSCAIGMHLGMQPYFALRGRSVDIKHEFRNGVSFYLRRVLPVLFVAAAVETFITPLVIYTVST